MDKDLIKGVLCVLGAIAVTGGLFLAFSEDGAGKADCIANALKSGVAYGNISAGCKLGARS